MKQPRDGLGCFANRIGVDRTAVREGARPLPAIRSKSAIRQHANHCESVRYNTMYDQRLFNFQ